LRSKKQESPVILAQSINRFILALCALIRKGFLDFYVLHNFWFDFLDERAKKRGTDCHTGVRAGSQ